MSFFSAAAVFLPLTPLLTADSIAQTGTDHMLAALASEPALAVCVGESRVCAACPLNGGLGLLLRTGGGHHDSTCGCKPPDRMKEYVKAIKCRD